MHVSQELKNRVNEKLREVIAKAEAHYHETFPFPTVVYRKRGTTAGTACAATWTIDLNSVLLNENVDNFIARTVPHEMAHLIDHWLHPENFEYGVSFDRRGRYRRTKRSVHGPTWRSIMIVIGADPSRCHTYDVTNAKVKKRNNKKFVWKCSCGDTMRLGSQRHNKMITGRMRYWMPGHKNCGGYSYACNDGSIITRLRRDGYTVRTQNANRQLAAEVPVPTVVRRHPAATSLREQAAELYRQASGIRGAFIILCENRLAMKKSTASTYHYNFKSGKWNS